MAQHQKQRPSHDLLERARQLHQAGNLAEAKALCRRLLAIYPKHIDAMLELGVIEIERGDFAAVVKLMEKAISIQPNAVAYNLLGGGLGYQKNMGRHWPVTSRRWRLIPAMPMHLITRVASCMNWNDIMKLWKVLIRL